MSNYMMVGGDGNEYGPVTAQDLRNWVKQGRANAQTQVKQDDGNWRNLGSFPEFSDLFGATPAPMPQSAPSPAMSIPMTSPHATPYSLTGGGTSGSAREAVMGVIAPLAAAGGWMKMIAVLCFIGGALNVLSIWGIVIAWLPIWQGVLLWKAAGRAQAALMDGSEMTAEAATKSLKTYFTLMGVMVLLSIIAAVGIMVLAFIIGSSGAADEWFQY